MSADSVNICLICAMAVTVVMVQLAYLCMTPCRTGVSAHLVSLVHTVFTFVGILGLHHYCLKQGCPTFLFGGPHEQFLKWLQAGLSKSIKHKITTVVTVCRTSYKLMLISSV